MRLYVRELCRTALMAVAVASATAGAVRAQPAFDMEIVNRGKPVPDARIAFLASGGKVPLGETGSDGVVTIPMDVVDIGKGERVEVYEIECGGEIEIVFVRPEERGLLDEECEPRKEENPACECRRLGVFAWGDDVVIDLGTRTVGPRRGGEEAPPTDRGRSGNAPPVVIGVGAGVGWYTNLEDVVDDQPNLQSSDVSDTGFTLHGSVEFGLPGPLAIGFDGTYNQFDDFSQTFDPVPDRPSTSMIDFRSYTLGTYGLWRFEPHAGDRLGFWFGGGAEYIWNEADLVFGSDDFGAPVVEERDEDGLMGTARFGFDYYFGRRAGFRIGATYSRGESDGADERWLLGGEFLWLAKPWREEEIR